MNWLYMLCALTSDSSASPIEIPKPTDERLVVELVAREPDIVTPTGIAIDERGRIWVIENQTHQRPAEYNGPSGDRIRIYDAFGPDGRARQVKTFAEGFKNGMGLALARNGDLYFATRAEIMVLRDTNADDIADQQDVIVKLDTAGDYPHNGLSGFAFDAFDNVYFGLGENLGAPYKLIGSDGTTLSGGGEGGNIYRCRPDGSRLIRIATGFWNPFHLAFDAFGRLFAVDNDPDSRPPCRLLHIIPGGDYGYRFRNGRKGLHPFTAWNGELPGTLPMVAGTGEAPSGIVAYESNGLPSEYIGDLIVTSWGDHVIQRFTLRERGASFTSQAQTLVQGGESFYPVGIAVAPDGSLVVSDWADKSYPLHGKGRIWRIRMKEPPPDDGLRRSHVETIADREQLIKLLEHPKREIRDAAGHALIDVRPQMRPQDSKALMENLKELVVRDNMSPRGRIHALWASARSGSIGMKQWLDYEAPRKCKDSAVGAELVRLTVDLLHPRRRGDAPPEWIGPGTESVETTWLIPAALDQDVPAPIRLQALLGLYSEPALAAVTDLIDADPFLIAGAIETLGRPGNGSLLLEVIEDSYPNWLNRFQPRQSSEPLRRLYLLLALRRTGEGRARTAIPRFLKDRDPGVRRAAIQWVGEEHLRDFEPLLEPSAARPPVTRDLFEAFLAAKDLLTEANRKPTDEPSGDEFIVRILGEESQPEPLRAIALRSLRPDHPALGTDRLRRMVEGGGAGLRLEAIRTLAARSDVASQDVLRTVATNARFDSAIRAEAVLGLAHSAATSADTAQLLSAMLDGTDAGLRREALRSLRAAVVRLEVTAAVRTWLKKSVGSADADEIEQAELLLRTQAEAISHGGSAEVKERFAAAATGAGDTAEGQRVFFHPNGPQCFACHRVNGRGGAVGPDLSVIGRTLDREKIVRSILEPSKDIAPQFTPWAFALRDGRVVTGIILQDDPRGVITLGDTQGRTIEVNVSDIDERKAQDRSIMPDNIADRMTPGEFRDLVSYLMELK